MNRIIAAVIASPLMLPLGAAVVAPAAFTGCATGDAGQANATTLAQAKIWVTGITNAVTVAAGTYLADPNAPRAAQVRDFVAKLQTASTAFANLGDVSTARSAAQSIIAAAQQVALALPLGDKTGAYVQLGLTVIQSFIAALPPPPAAAAQQPKA